MKNIHLLPTDNPSRIARDFDKLILNSRLLSPILYKTQNIYITSDEEIKVRDWHFKNDKMVTKSYLIDNTCKKIILTTDQDLIKDGVQAIDDEFLEWFVKNPSCEEVEVSYDRDAFPYGVKTAKGYGWYKIIIPKEEPKRTHYLDELPNIDKDTLVKMWEATKPKLEPKQETLEEAAINNYKELYEGEPLTQDVPIDAFKDGAKWQAERMYSEEEMFAIIAEILHTPALRDGGWEDIFEWFKQFKKKQQ